MANPNILNVTTVTLSSNSVSLPNYSADGTSYSSWDYTAARLLISNPVGSNKVCKITSMIGFHDTGYNGSYVSGISVFTVLAGSSPTLANVKNYLHGSKEELIVRNTSSSTNPNVSVNNRYKTFGSPTTQPPIQSSVARSIATGDTSYYSSDSADFSVGSRSIICDPSSIFYLTEGLSLYAISRVASVTDRNGSVSYLSLANHIRYSWEEIG